MNEMEPHEAEVALSAWTRELMRRCGIHVERFRDGSMGLVNVPSKCVAAIDAMNQALYVVMCGDGLPEFLPEEPKPAPKKRARR